MSGEPRKDNRHTMARSQLFVHANRHEVENAGPGGTSTLRLRAVVNLTKRAISFLFFAFLPEKVPARAPNRPSRLLEVAYLVSSDVCSCGSWSQP
jgi:hypothetical protein